MEVKKKEIRALVRSRMRSVVGPEIGSGGDFFTPDDALRVALRIESLPQFAAAHTVALYCALPDEVPTGTMLSRWMGLKRLALPVISQPAAPRCGVSGGGISVFNVSSGDAPSSDISNGEMNFHEFTGSLSPGAFGILEPDFQLPDESAPLSFQQSEATRNLIFPDGNAPLSFQQSEATRNLIFPDGNAPLSFRQSEATRNLILPSEIDLMLIPGMAFDLAGGRLGRGRGFYDRYLSHPDAAHIYKVGICPPWSLVDEVPAEPHDIKMDLTLVF